MNSTTRRSLSLLLVLLTLLSILSVPAYAKNACSVVSGTTKRASSFYVKTSSIIFTHSIKFEQTKGSFTGVNAGGKNCSGKGYAAYTIKVYNQKTGKTSTYHWDGCANGKYTLYLDRGTAYDITLTYDAMRTYNANRYQWMSWSTDPSWKVKKTNNITLCG